jgi:hypothetical protein
MAKATTGEAVDLAGIVAKMDVDKATAAAETLVPGVPKPPTKVDEMDRLRVENAALKLATAQAQGELIAIEFNKCREGIAKYTKDLIVMRGEMSKKYGVDFSKHAINQDGTIVASKG